MQEKYPPPQTTPSKFVLHQFLLLNVGNSMKHEENMKFWKKYIFYLIF